MLQTIVVEVFWRQTAPVRAWSATASCGQPATDASQAQWRTRRHCSRSCGRGRANRPTTWGSTHRGAACLQPSPATWTERAHETKIQFKQNKNAYALNHIYMYVCISSEIETCKQTDCANTEARSRWMMRPRSRGTSATVAPNGNGKPRQRFISYFHKERQHERERQRQT